MRYVKPSLMFKPLLCLSLVVAFSGCQQRSKTKRQSDVRDPGGLIIPTQPLPPIDSGEGTVKWPNGQVSYTIRLKNRSYLQVNGLMAPNTYRRWLENGNPVQNFEVRDGIREDVLVALKALENSLGEEFLMKDVIGETGYYSMWIPYSQDLWTKLQNSRELPTSLTLEAVSSDPNQLGDIRKISAEVNGMIAAAGSKDGTDGFSGLLRIGVSNEFLQSLEQELGEKADGSMVKVGITDTGITYNHPSFADASGRSRVAYMKDFTEEGKVYFPDTAHFTVRLGTAQEAKDLGAKEENLLIAEDVSAHVSPSASTPAADGDNLIKLAQGTPLQVPAEIRSAVSRGATVKLGLLAEIAYNGDPEEGSFDLNRNNKKDDIYGLMLVVPEGATGLQDYQVYVGLDAIGTLSLDSKASLAKALNLVKAVPLRDFNSSHETMQSFAERFGIALDKAKLKTAAGGVDVASITAAIVGYDSGTHGSHVAGIIAGRKTISNDKELTLARGVAPAAQIFSDRVCSNTRGCSASAAIQDLALTAKVDVINMSLGGLSELNDGYDTQSLLIDRITQISNTLFVISAGNAGPGLQTVGSPSTSRLALSVAASASASIMGRQSQVGVPTPGAADEDFVMSFSSRGPLNNGGFKPNLTAPGTQLSAVGLNQAGRSGTAIYQGTSMAAPTVTGAYALLLDAARRYNAKHPLAPLPTDVLTLRKVLLGSTRAFDVQTFNPATKVEKNGQYTWVDEGTGIIDVPAAWTALKQLARDQVSSGVIANGQVVQTVYEIRSVVTGRNGTVYDGKPAEAAKITAYGAGLWIDTTSTRNIYSVGIARRLPLAASGMQSQDEQGDAFARLVASGEFFKLSTEIHGSHVAWIKANTLYTANPDGSNRCDSLANNELLTIVGLGAIDSQGAAGVGGTQESTVYFCVDRAKIASLPRGDHGALIRAYRTTADGTVTEPVPSFIIPVYLALPHESLSGGKSYTVANGEVKSLGVNRNYIDVPADISSMKVSISVNKATSDAAGQAQNCSGISLSVFAGSNIAKPVEFRSAAASNCTGPGYSIGPDEEKRSKFEAEIAAPRPGLWDLHVLGAARFPSSRYQLRVDYAKASVQATSIKGDLTALNGNVNVEIKETSRTSSVSPDRSVYSLDKALGRTQALVTEGQKIDLPNKAGNVLRTYPADIARVEIASSGAAGSDIDLELFECSLTGTECKSLSISGSPTDQELLSFAPAANKAYKAVAEGFKVMDTRANVQIAETLSFKTGVKGIIAVNALGSARFWNVIYSLDKNDPFFSNEIFRNDPTLEVLGSLKLASPELNLATIPVQIRLL